MQRGPSAETIEMRVASVGRSWPAALGAVTLLMAAPAWAQAQVTTTGFVMDPNGPVTSAPAVAKKGSTLLALSVRGERAVRLEADLDATATNWLGAKLKRPMLKGQVLVAAADRRGVFCAPVKEGMLYAVSPCLTDADGDGRFEALGATAFNAGSVDGLVVTDKGAVLGVRFSATTPLGAPVAYTPVAYGEGAAGEARLPEGTDLVEVEGIRVRVLGFEPNGALRYQIEGVASARPVTLAFRPAPTVYYIYY